MCTCTSTLILGIYTYCHFSNDCSFSHKFVHAAAAELALRCDPELTQLVVASQPGASSLSLCSPSARLQLLFGNESTRTPAASARGIVNFLVHQSSLHSLNALTARLLGDPLHCFKHVSLPRIVFFT